MRKNIGNSSGKALKGQTGGITYARLVEFIARKMGLQIPHSVCAQVPPEEAVWQVPDSSRPDHQGFMPPRFSIAFVIGFIKGKSAVLIHRTVLKQKEVSGLHFWTRGYCVSTVGLDEQTIRNYIREQEHYEKQQLEFDFD